MLAGIVIAFLGALSNFAFMPYYPFWRHRRAGLNVFVIWALRSGCDRVTGMARGPAGLHPVLTPTGEVLWSAERCA